MRSRGISSFALCLCMLWTTAHAVAPKWQTPLGWGPPGYFSTAQEACQAQHDHYAPNNPGPITAAPYKGSWTSYLCDWKTHADGPYPWNPLPTVVTLQCVDENNQPASGYQRVPPGICVPSTEPPESRPACQYDNGGKANPTAGNPIVLANGAKVESHIDYEDADKRLTIARTYRSRFGTGDEGWRNYPVPQGVGDLWRLSFQWEMTLDSLFYQNGGGYFAISTPDGSVYAFQLQTDGSITSRNAGVADFKVEFVNPAPGSPVSYASIWNNGGQFALTTSSGDRITLDLYRRWSTKYTQGHPSQIVFRGGYTWNLDYADKDELESISDSLGRSISVEWYYSLDADDTGVLKPRSIQSIEMPDGTLLTYDYESFSGTQVGGQRYSRLARFERHAPNSTVVDAASYLYEDADLPSALTGIVDHSGVRYASWEYDDFGHATLSKHAGDVDTTAIAYSASADGTYHYRTVTNALGKAATYTFKRVTSGSNKELLLESVVGQPSTNCIGTTRSWVYTSNRISSSTDEAGTQTRFTYGTDRRVQTKTEAYGTPLQRVTTYTWHSTFGVPTQISQPGLTTNLTYDGSGRLLTVTKIDTTTHTVPYATGGLTRAWTYSYNAQGLRASLDGPLPGAQDTVLYEYNSMGYPRKLTNAAGHAWEITSFDGAGRPLQMQDPNGAITTLAYDGHGRVTTFAKAGVSTSYEYDDVGNLAKVTFPGGAWLEYTHDAARRLTHIHDHLGNRIEYQLDVAGNRTQKDVYDPYNELHYTQGRVYDELSRLMQVVGAEQQVTEFSYDLRGHLVSETRPSTATTTREFDKLDRLSKVTDAANGITLYSYNALGQLTLVTDPRGKETSYTYNAFGDLIQQISADSGTTVYTVDDAGNLLTRTDARNKTGTYTHDVLNRVTSLTYADQTIGYTYDSGTNQNGRLTQVTDGTGSTSWTYDAVGRVLSRQQSMGVVKNVGYSYDANGLLQTLALPSGNTITYAYADGKVTSLTLNSSTTILSNVLYKPFGPTQGWTWGNGSFAIREYDLNGVITQMDSAGLKTYSYDNDFRITGIADASSSALSQNYGYDLLNRLTSATGTTLNQSWTYDASGNRLTQGGSNPSTYAVSSTSNRLDSISGSLTRTYANDAAGNITSDGSAVYVYNDAGRMVSSTKAGVLTTYAFNGLGQRVKKISGTASRYFVYDKAGRLVGEYDSAGALIQETIWWGNIPVATIRPSGASIELFYVHADHLNTPRRISRPSDNAVVWRWDSDPFGTSGPNEDPDGDSNLFVYSLRFAGQHYDGETGLHYNYFRDYDPAVGRYAQSDPIGLRGGINTYAYVNGNPVRFVDPLGLQVDVPPPAGARENPFDAAPSDEASADETPSDDPSSASKSWEERVQDAEDAERDRCLAEEEAAAARARGDWNKYYDQKKLAASAANRWHKAVDPDQPVDTSSPRGPAPPAPTTPDLTLDPVDVPTVTPPPPM